MGMATTKQPRPGDLKLSVDPATKKQFDTIRRIRGWTYQEAARRAALALAKQERIKLDKASAA